MDCTRDSLHIGAGLEGVKGALQLLQLVNFCALFLLQLLILLVRFKVLCADITFERSIVSFKMGNADRAEGK